MHKDIIDLKNIQTKLNNLIKVYFFHWFIQHLVSAVVKTIFIFITFLCKVSYTNSNVPVIVAYQISHNIKEFIILGNKMEMCNLKFETPIFGKAQPLFGSSWSSQLVLYMIQKHLNHLQYTVFQNVIWSCFHTSINNSFPCHDLLCWTV